MTMYIYILVSCFVEDAVTDGYIDSGGFAAGVKGAS